LELTGVSCDHPTYGNEGREGGERGREGERERRKKKCTSRRKLSLAVKMV
jgi:hypothetical protein